MTLVNTTTGTSTTGFANPLIAAIPEVYSFTAHGTAAGRLSRFGADEDFRFDGGLAGGVPPTPAMGRSTASPPLWMTIEVNGPAGGSMDLLPSSDTGMFNDDNVTSEASPAFSGTGPANNIVRVFAQRIDGNPTARLRHADRRPAARGHWQRG